MPRNSALHLARLQSAVAAALCRRTPRWWAPDLLGLDENRCGLPDVFGGGAHHNAEFARLDNSLHVGVVKREGIGRQVEAAERGLARLEENLGEAAKLFHGSSDAGHEILHV